MTPVKLGLKDAFRKLTERKKNPLKSNLPDSDQSSPIKINI